jgi:hypothetical protein
MAEQLYKQQTADAGAAGAGAAGDGAGQAGNGHDKKEEKKDGEDVIDADFKEL